MENEKGIVKLTRKQLYDEIWALSVAGVARKYNLNYGKLIATCKVENISFPSSGYWTKKNMGKDVSNEIVEFSGLEDTEISLIKSWSKPTILLDIEKFLGGIIYSLLPLTFICLSVFEFIIDLLISFLAIFIAAIE